NGQFRTSVESIRRQILSGNFARLSRQKLDVIVFPEHRKNFHFLPLLVNFETDLKREMITGVPKCDAHPRALLSRCDGGCSRDSNTRQVVELREVVIRGRRSVDGS